MNLFWKIAKFLGSVQVDGTTTLTGGTTFADLTASTVPYLNSSKKLTSSGVTPTTLAFLDATASIQTQLNAASVVSTVPTKQVFKSGSGSYVRPASVKWLKIKICGGGGGGGGSSTQGAGDGGTGGSGTVSTFGTALITAMGGGGGGSAGAAGNGGAGEGTVNSPAIELLNIGGGGGGSSFVMPSGSTNACSGHGGNSALGGGAASQYSNTGIDGRANTGGGGSGANINTGGAVIAGAGGGGANYIEAIIGTPDGTYSYSVGGGGTAGGAGTSGSAGGVGGSGIIIIEEHYNY